MSSPAASASGDQDKKPLEQITFRFCSECSNMLYPKEDEHEHKLMFTCRTCNFSEEATSSCIFRNIQNNAAGETAGVTQDVGSDPTVGDPSIIHIEGMCGPRDSDASAYACCLSCGGIIMCGHCGESFAIIPASDRTINLQDCETGLVDTELVDIRPWTESIDDLASYMARTEGFFGSWLEQREDEDMEEDPETEVAITLAPDLMEHTGSLLVPGLSN
jgi:DNA-directed RNA polymerase II subunit RPB9